MKFWCDRCRKLVLAPLGNCEQCGRPTLTQQQTIEVLIHQQAQQLNLPPQQTGRLIQQLRQQHTVG